VNDLDLREHERLVFVGDANAKAELSALLINGHVGDTQRADVVQKLQLSRAEFTVHVVDVSLDNVVALDYLTRPRSEQLSSLQHLDGRDDIPHNWPILFVNPLQTRVHERFTAHD